MSFEPMVPLAIAVAAFVLVAAFIAFAGIRGPKRGRRLRIARRALIAVALLAVALRPGIPGFGDRVTVTTGNDIFIVMDTTGSVSAEDYADGETRLSGMKQDVAQLVDQFAGARFSLITFDAVAVMRMPLTTDTSALVSSMEVLTPELTIYSHGSSISEPHDLLLQALQDDQQAHPERQRIVFYLGDGEQTISEAPASFADLAPFVQAGAVLGYGTTAGGRMLENNGAFADDDAEPSYIQDRSVSPRQDALSIYNEDTLTTIATELGVGFEHRTAPGPLDPGQVLSVPSQPESVQTRERTIVELYWIAGLAAFALLLWEAGIVAIAVVDSIAAGRRRP